MFCTGFAMYYGIQNHGVMSTLVNIYGGTYSESTEPMDAVNILPLGGFEPTTSATRYKLGRFV